MKHYWQNQLVVDAVAAILMTLILWLLPYFGAKVIFYVDRVYAAELSIRWLAPTLTLLGLISATTSFIFTIIDKPDFSVVAKSQSLKQLWKVFSQTLGWLFFGATVCIVGSVAAGEGAVSVLVLYAGTFSIFILLISLFKFVWVMQMILSVRIKKTP